MNPPADAESADQPSSPGPSRSRIDPVPELLRQMGAEQPETRLAALEDLARLGALASEATPRLGELLGDSDPAVRKAAARALGAMGFTAINELSGALRHEDREVRRQAVWALGRMGPHAKAVMPALSLALRDPDARTASGAAQALGNMGRDAVAAVPALISALQRANLVLCRLASRALSQIGPPALPALLEKLDDPDPYVRREVAVAIGFMEVRAKSAAVPLLRKLRALSPSGPITNAPIVPEDSRETRITPVKALDCSVEDDRVIIIRTLARIGAAGEAREYLLTLLNDPDVRVRQAASQATMQILGW